MRAQAKGAEGRSASRVREGWATAAFCYLASLLLSARSIAKFNMSLCTLGHAEEFRPDGIAVNRQGRLLRLLQLLPCDSPPLPTQHLAPHRHRDSGGRQPAGRRRVCAAVAPA